MASSEFPLIFLIIGTTGNIALDILFVMVLPWGVAGAAVGTVLAQGFTAVGCLLIACGADNQKNQRRKGIPHAIQYTGAQIIQSR